MLTVLETAKLDAPTLTDRCPYSRDFGPDFHDCVAYTQEEFTALDTGYHPLRPVLTCRHLSVGSDVAGAFYPRCALGTAEERAAWARDVGEARLRELREFSLEYRRYVGELMPRVWEAKGRALAARAEGGDTKAATAELQARVEELLEAATSWIDIRAEPLSAAGLDPELLKSLVAVATQDWVASPKVGMAYQVPDHVLQRFPADIQVFIRAGR